MSPAARPRRQADIAITDRSGAALVADPIPAVVDLGLMRKAEQARFVADLLDELFTTNRQLLTIVAARKKMG